MMILLKMNQFKVILISAGILALAPLYCEIRVWTLCLFFYIISYHYRDEQQAF